MQLHRETFNIIHKPCRFSSHSSCKTWSNKSPIKIMLNVGIILAIGINNLWNHVNFNHSFKRHHYHHHNNNHHGAGLGLVTVSGMAAVLLFLFILLSCSVDTEAFPAPSPNPDPASRAPRDHNKYFFPTSIGSSSSNSNNRSIGRESNSSGGAEATLSLSIFSPLDILRQNMLLEIQRKRIRHAKQRQMQSNKEYLDRIGR